MAVPGAGQRGAGGDPPGMLPPSPATTQGLVRPSTPRTSETEKSETRMETSETAETGQQKPRQAGVRRQSPSSSPDTDQDSDFVLVPNSLAGDSSRNKNMHGAGMGVSPMTARRIGSRPGSLPVISKGHSAEPIPVRNLETPAPARGAQFLRLFGNNR